MQTADLMRVQLYWVSACNGCHY